MLSVESEQEQLKFSTGLLQTEADEDEEGDADKIDIQNAHIELEAELQHHQSQSSSQSSQGNDDLDPSKFNENDDDIECLQLDTLAHTYLRIENYRRLEVSKVRPILLRPPPTNEAANAPYGSLEAIRAAAASKQQPTAYIKTAAPMQKLQPVPQPVPPSSNPHMANAIPRARPHYRPIIVPSHVPGTQTTYLATAQSLSPDLVNPSYAAPRPSTTWNSNSTSANQQRAQLAINPSIVATSFADSSSHVPSSASYPPNPSPKVSLMSPTEASSLASNIHQLTALSSLASSYIPASSGHLYQNDGSSSSTVSLSTPQSAAMNKQKHSITTAPTNHASSQSMPTMGSHQAPSRQHDIIEILDD